MRGADLGAVHLLPLPRRAGGGLGVERAQLGIGLAQRVIVHPGAGANAAIATPTRRARGVPWRAWLRSRRRILVGEPGDVAAAVAPQLLLDPVDRGAVARRALPPVAELREALDRRLVMLEIEARDEPGNGIRCRPRGILRCDRRCDRDQERDGAPDFTTAHTRSLARAPWSWR